MEEEGLYTMYIEENFALKIKKSGIRTGRKDFME